MAKVRRRETRPSRPRVWSSRSKRSDDGRTARFPRRAASERAPERLVMTPAIKATHAITRASTTLRALARRRGGRRTVSTLMPSRHENRQCLGLRQFFGSGTLVSPDLWCPSILWVSLPQRRSISPDVARQPREAQLIAIAERLEREVVRPTTTRQAGGSGSSPATRELGSGAWRSPRL